MKRKHLPLELRINRAGQSASNEPDTFVYFLINESPTYIYSREYSTVYDLLQSLFGEDPIPEDEAVEAVKTLGLDAEATLYRMTRHRYLHKASLKEVLK